MDFLGQSTSHFPTKCLGFLLQWSNQWAPFLPSLTPRNWVMVFNNWFLDLALPWSILLLLPSSSLKATLLNPFVCCPKPWADLEVAHLWCSWSKHVRSLGGQFAIIAIPSFHPTPLSRPRDQEKEILWVSYLFGSVETNRPNSFLHWLLISSWFCDECWRMKKENHGKIAQ